LEILGLADELAALYIEARKEAELAKGLTPGLDLLKVAEDKEKQVGRLIERAAGIVKKLESADGSRGYERATRLAVLSQARRSLEGMERMRRELSEIVRGMKTLVSEKLAEEPFDFESCFRPIVRHYAALLGPERVGDGRGRAVFMVSGHEVEFLPDGINVRCEDSTGIRAVLDKIAKRVPEIVAGETTPDDRAKLSEETREIIKRCEEREYTRLDALLGEPAKKAKKKKGGEVGEARPMPEAQQ
jgi:hypothetical protein